MMSTLEAMVRRISFTTGRIYGSGSTLKHIYTTTMKNIIALKNSTRIALLANIYLRITFLACDNLEEKTSSWKSVLHHGSRVCCQKHPTVRSTQHLSTPYRSAVTRSRVWHLVVHTTTFRGGCCEESCRRQFIVDGIPKGGIASSTDVCCSMTCTIVWSMILIDAFVERHPACRRSLGQWDARSLSARGCSSNNGVVCGRKWFDSLYR